MKRWRASVAFLCQLLVLQSALGQQPAGQRGLRIVVVEGSGNRNVVQQIPPRPLIVRVEDANSRPVAGATVVFNTPELGPSGEFGNDSRTMRVVTDQDGLASAGVFHPNSITGPYQIRVTAELQGETATTLISQTKVFGTTEFFSAELEKVSQQLSESEDRLKVVKSSRQYELPEQRDANLRTLDRLASDKKANAEAMDRYATIRLNLETQLSQTPQFLPKPVSAVPPAARNPLVEELHKAQSEYDEVASKYTQIHPEVQTAKARLERLKQQVPAEALASSSGDATGSANTGDVAESGMEPNPLYQKLIAQLQEVKTEFGIREKGMTWIDSQIGKYTSRVENTPTAEQDIAEVVRLNQDLKKQYDDLKDKLSQARLAESLESKQKGSQFIVVDPANYPLVPSKPNKTVVLLGGTLFSLILSIAFAAVIDIARQKVWTQSQVETFWGVPVLVDIPEILTDEDLAAGRKKMVRYAAYSCAAVAVYGVCLYGVYLKHGFILQQLDPVIQKLVYR